MLGFDMHRQRWVSGRSSQSLAGVLPIPLRKPLIFWFESVQADRTVRPAPNRMETVRLPNLRPTPIVREIHQEFAQS